MNTTAVKSCEHSMCKLATFINSYASLDMDEIINGFSEFQAGV